ncbi:hypothetical protein Dsin_003979 [Dipteronia sinensis]|uniref:Uncharacterized protein n=1 Tax=Dipteronia sinensis TaxID=43782 RepID=A0AAE0BA07_9ROSI|nr:hypothetical protein Dsin_003979 [Dipteronia sinensis]
MADGSSSFFSPKATLYEELSDNPVELIEPAVKEAESEVMEFGKSTGLDVVRVCPTLVLGSMLQTAANSSSMFLVRQLKATLMEGKNRR